jgi:tetratricopeptide (TPR) repeat protein
VNGYSLRLLLWATVLLTGCAGLFAPGDPRQAEEIVAQAETMVANKAYSGAAELYATAQAKEPANGRHYLRRGELLEALGGDKDARATYRIGLKNVDATSPEHLELSQRLALLSAEHLQDIDTAEDLLARMPTGSVARIDLAGYLYYQAGQYDLAIKMFNQALALATDPDQKAIVYYHAALVYDALLDDKNSVTSLFHAINHATHLGLIRDISALWAKVNDNQPLPRAGSAAK